MPSVATFKRVPAWPGRGWRLALVAACGLWLAGCASTPKSYGPPPEGASGASRAAAQAAFDQLGARYRFGGETPREGFDCSGLTYFSYRNAGVVLPRTAEEQYSVARKIPSSQLRVGDLLFFRTAPPKVSHVGIYIGDGTFVHASPGSGHVDLAHLDRGYWRRAFAGAGRVAPMSVASGW